MNRKYCSYIYVVAQQKDAWVVQAWYDTGQVETLEDRYADFPTAVRHAQEKGEYDGSFAFVDKTQITGRPTLELLWPPMAGSREGE